MEEATIQILQETIIDTFDIKNKNIKGLVDFSLLNLDNCLDY